MKQQELDYILTSMLKAYDNVSDLNFTVDKPCQVEASGQLKPVLGGPLPKKLTPFQTESIALNLIKGDHRLLTNLLSQGSCDISYQLAGKARFRVNIFFSEGGVIPSSCGSCPRGCRRSRKWRCQTHFTEWPKKETVSFW